MGSPAFRQKAQMIPPKLVTAPMDKSIPPADIKNVIGTATINEKLAVLKISKIFDTLKKFILTMATAIIRIARGRSVPISGF